MRKNSYLTVTDQFCGGGGSSQGVRRYKQRTNTAIEVKMAMNHWRLAVETHATNFPETDHDCADISASDPRRYHSTDILITSPECTNQSGSNGKKKPKKQMEMFDKGILDPAAERSRATMWDVVRFTEFHKYNIIVVENVVEARNWIMWDTWLTAMHTLGYLHKCLYANSMHFHPTPQSRDRLYVIFWKKGNKAPDLTHTPLAPCPVCNKDVYAIQRFKKSAEQNWGKYNKQYYFTCPADGHVVEPYYYASFNIIDWSDRGTLIGERKKPLSPNTERRVNHGLSKYRDYPFIINNQQSTGIGFRVKGVHEMINTISTNPSFRIVQPPFIIKGEHAMQQKGYTKSTGEPVQTQATRQSMGLVSPPVSFLINNKGQSNSKGITEAMPAQTTKPHLGIVSSGSFNAFLAANYNTGHSLSHITGAIGAQSTRDRHAVVSYETPKIEECYYRMLKAKEVQRAMAFDDDYIVLGNSKEKVKQLGNAVTPPVMEWIIERCVESLS